MGLILGVVVCVFPCWGVCFLVKLVHFGRCGLSAGVVWVSGQGMGEEWHRCRDRAVQKWREGVWSSVREGFLMSREELEAESLRRWGSYVDIRLRHEGRAVSVSGGLDAREKVRSLRGRVEVFYRVPGDGADLCCGDVYEDGRLVFSRSTGC